ncbi:nuclear transport factor 2 family protein [Chitinophagaceae bacterium 26-R-25]|nr:nuclear transport factor 2 family protein [Chitinophagaceae bacterium 26-R-25]
MERKFANLETSWMNAWKDKDEATARKLIAEEFTLTSSLSTGDLVNKEQWISKAMNHFHCKSFKIDLLKARVYGNTAVLNIWFYQDAEANGKDWSGDFLLTDVWVENDEGWQVVARHASWLKK